MSRAEFVGKGNLRRASVWAGEVTEGFLEEGASALGVDRGGEEGGAGVHLRSLVTLKVGVGAVIRLCPGSGKP